MGKIILAIIFIQIVIFVVPIIVYGIFSAIAGLKTPEGASPLQFMISVFISKFGTAIAFALIFYFSKGAFSESWLLYAFIWWVMYTIGEIGQAIGPNYSWKEAIAGIISEGIYFPAAAFIVQWLVK